jgi:hypothetical protein
MRIGYWFDDEEQVRKKARRNRRRSPAARWLHFYAKMARTYSNNQDQWLAEFRRWLGGWPWK